MKRKKIWIIILIIVIISLLTLIAVSTFSWANTLRIGGSNILEIKQGLTLIIDEEFISVNNGRPLLDTTAIAGEAKPYTFKLINQSNKYFTYDISTEDIDITLAKSTLRYALSQDEREYSTPSSFNVENISQGMINPGQTILFDLKVWIDWEASNETQNKSYSGKILIDAVESP